jgi:outer membrane protein OmpA-like peptidoglycan-associated protein
MQRRNADAAADDLAKMAKHLDQTGDAIAASLKSIDAHLLNYQSTTKEGLANVATTLDQASRTADTDLNRIEAGLTRTGNSVDAIRQLINHASPPPPPAPPTGTCFTPGFRIDPDKNVQKLRTESAAERQRIGLSDGTKFREIANQLVFFETAASRLSSGAEARLKEFLASRISGNAALSIHGSADRRGSRAKNERLSRDRGVEVAMLVASTHRYPPIVELNWSVSDTPTEPRDRGQAFK